MAAAPPTAARDGLRWRLLLGDGRAFASAGAWNMAVDDALLESARAGGSATLRLYGWRPACLSVGRNQPISGMLVLEELERRGWQLVRRPTGGRAVLHADEISYSVSGSVGLLGRPRAAYAAISAALAEGLRELGVDARVARGENGGTPRGAEPRCFAGAAPGEVGVRGRKLLGSAQRRSGGVLLQHGSLLLAGSQDAVRALFAAPAPAVLASPETTLARELGVRPADERVVEVLAAAFTRWIAPDLEPSGLTPAERALAERRSRAYSSEAWTWRR